MTQQVQQKQDSALPVLILLTFLTLPYFTLPYFTGGQRKRACNVCVRAWRCECMYAPAAVRMYIYVYIYIYIRIAASVYGIYIRLRAEWISECFGVCLCTISCTLNALVLACVLFGAL